MRRWIWIVLALIALAGVIVVVFEVEDTADIDVTSAPPAAPVVSVIVVSKQTAQAQVSAFAEIRPRWDAALRATVNGRITHVHDGALLGARVAQGDPLFSIEKTQYRAALATAEVELAQAELDLLNAQNNVAIARRQFERDNVTAPTDLALKLPQLRIAEQSVAVAKARLEVARQDLSDTEITAPFDGFVTQRMASLGQSVSMGEPLVRVADNHNFEIIAEISQSDWALLDQPIAGQMAEIYHRDGTPLGQARVRSGGGFLEQDTRQMRVFLEIITPSDAILAGDFVRITFHGRALENTLRVPEGALTRAGYIWLVDADDLLMRLKPDILFRSHGMITITTPDGAGPWNVAKIPLASFLPGQRVTPQMVGD